MVNRYSYLFRFILISVLIFGLAACSSKRFANKALKYDEAGMFHEAAALYLRSLTSNPSNMDARMGLMRTGSLVFEEKLQNFTNFHRNSQHKEAVYAFQDLEKYYHSVSSVGVKLEFPEQYKIYYNESKQEYLAYLYREGMKALNLEAFATAEPLLAEVLLLDPAYKDSKEHWVTARYEPIYRNGLSFFENGLYRKAYYSFDQILQANGPYKESVDYKERSLKAATITIGVLPFYTNSYGERTVANELKAKTISHIQELKSPFYKLINDPVIANMPQLDQAREPLAALQWIQKAGADFTVQTVLYTRILRYNAHTSSLRRIETPAYLKKITEVTSESGQKETKTDYIKTSYSEFSRQSSASLTVEFSLMDIKTGEILVTDVITLNDADEIAYAEFKGNYKELIPGEWEKIDKELPGDRVYDNATHISEIQKKFTATKELRSGQQIATQLLQNAAQNIARKIENYNPEN